MFQEGGWNHCIFRLCTRRSVESRVNSFDGEVDVSVVMEPHRCYTGVLISSIIENILLGSSMGTNCKSSWQSTSKGRKWSRQYIECYEE